MKKRLFGLFMPILLVLVCLLGCGKEVKSIGLEDGEYLVEFTTDSTMFHLNDTCNGDAVLTVKDGQGTVHIILASKNFINVYPGLKKDAEKDGAILIDPVVESVTYPDGMTEEVNTYDVPVNVLDEEFDLAVIGKKGVWYDHKVMISNPRVKTEEEITADIAENKSSESDNVENDTLGVITEIYISLEGGTGKAKIESPASVVTTDEGYTVTLKWSSPHYDYMIVDGEKYLPVNEEGNSVFEIPFKSISTSQTVIADTVAMSEPHEIEYTLVFSTKEPVVAE